MPSRRQTRAVSPRSLLALLATAACGVAGSDATSAPAAGDAGPDRKGDAAVSPLDGGVSDGTPDGAPTKDSDGGAVWSVPTTSPDCDRTKPFLPPTTLTNFPPFTNAVALSPDERITLFSAGASKVIYQQSRPDRLSAFGGSVALPSLTLPNDIPYAALWAAADGLSLFLQSGPIAARPDIYVARRASVTQPFGIPTDFFTLNAATPGSWVRGPSVRPDGAEFFYSAKFADTHQIYRAPIVGGKVGTSILQTALNEAASGEIAGSAHETVIAFDGLKIFFRRVVAPGGEGIWVAERSSINDDFHLPKPVSELNTTRTEAPLWISPDGCRIYFRRDPDIMMSSRAN